MNSCRSRQRRAVWPDRAEAFGLHREPRMVNSYPDLATARWAVALEGDAFDIERDDTLADVLTFLRGEPDWFDLYKAFELMRDDINRRLGRHRYEQMGWPDKKIVDEFSESAQVYRHSRVKWGRFDLSTAMKFDNARAFVQSLARKWLDWRYPSNT